MSRIRFDFFFLSYKGMIYDFIISYIAQLYLESYTEMEMSY